MYRVEDFSESRGMGLRNVSQVDTVARDDLQGQRSGWTSAQGSTVTQRILGGIERYYDWFQEEPEHFGFKLLRPD